MSEQTLTHLPLDLIPLYARDTGSVQAEEPCPESLYLWDAEAVGTSAALKPLSA